MALFGQERVPKADPRIRRNFDRFKTQEFLVDAPLSISSGVIGLSIGDGLEGGASLAIDLASNPGLEFSSGDLKALVQGVLAIDASGIKLNTGNGLIASGGNLIVNLAATPGLEFSGTALTAKVGNGLELTASGVEIDLATDPGLEFSTGDIRVLVQDPIKRDASGVGLNIGDGLVLESSNLVAKTRLLSANTADANTVANTVTETAYTTDYTIPANFLAVGKVLRVTCSGRISDTGAPDVTFRLKIGGTTLHTYTATLAGGTDDHFEFKEDIVVTATGATGSVSGHDIWAVIAGILVDSPKQTAVVDTTASNLMQLTIEWSVADAANTATLELFMVETLDN